MSEHINIIRQAVDHAIANFSIPVLQKKTVLHYYLTPKKIIAITDVIAFHEVGYCYVGHTVDRCVIEAEYIEKQPDYYRKFYSLEELQCALEGRKAA